MPLFQLSENEIAFPPAYFADSEGLIAIGGDLSPERVLQAYSSGIYFWYGPMDPIKWWSPDPRVILYPNEVIVEGSHQYSNYRKISTQKEFEVLLCKLQSQENKGEMGPHWVTEEMKATYQALYNSDHVDAWCIEENDNLIGGTFGIRIGKALFLEYILIDNSSQSQGDYNDILFSLWNEILKLNISFIDIQKETIRINDTDISEISRLEYLEQLNQAISLSPKSTNPSTSLSNHDKTINLT